MAIHLVVDNTNKKDEIKEPTCRLNCELFDHITGECGINHNINPDDPYLAARCGDMIYKDEDDDSFYLPSSETENENVSIDEDEIILSDESIFYEFNGADFDPVQSKYPNEPDYPSNREDAIWYVSPNKTFGCWIINKYKNRFISLTENEEPEAGWSQNVYKSPYPLHDHKSSVSLASRIAWLVDEDGYGQYVLLGNGKISMLSEPRPFDWI